MAFEELSPRTSPSSTNSGNPMHLVDTTMKKHVYCSIPVKSVAPAYLPLGPDKALDRQAFAAKIRNVALEAASVKEDQRVVAAITDTERFRVVSYDGNTFVLDLGPVLAGSHWISSPQSPRNKPTLEMSLRKLLLDRLVAPHMRSATRDKILVYRDFPSANK